MIIPFLVCGSTPLIVDELFGEKWQLIVGAVTLVLWLILRPWRFGLATAEERTQLRVQGTVGLAGLVLTYTTTYWF